MEEGLKIYPNPSKGTFTLRKLTNINLLKANIYDINGRFIKAIDLSNFQISKSIDISEFTPGLYFMTVSSEDAEGVFKLIKQ